MAEGTAVAHGTADQTPPVLSVVMPNYNHAPYIAAALAAVLAQSRPPDEIIIIDDGSTDDSRSLIEQWAAREPRIRPFFNDTNAGAIACINQGLRAARGRYVCLMAADDRACPDFFSAALEALEHYPQVALFCAEVDVHAVDAADQRRQTRPIIRPSHRRRAFTPVETQRLLRRNDNFVVPLAAVFRRDLVLAEGGFDPRLGSMADGFLSRRLALKHGFCFAPQVVVTWQIRSDSLSRTTARTPATVVALLGETRAHIAGDPVFPAGYAAVFERRLRFATCRLALLDTAPDWAFVRDVGPGAGIDRALLSAARRLPQRCGVLAALVWLTLRLRPYSLLAIAETALRRRRAA